MTSKESSARGPSEKGRAGRPRAARLCLAGLAGAALLAACGSSGRPAASGKTSSTAKSSTGSTTKTTTYSAACSPGATKLTFWDWSPGQNRVVALFNKTHPKICVTLQNVGAGNPEYVKLVDALKSGSGAPDIAEVEYDELPSFEVTHNVVNLASYGAGSVQKDFVPWVWKEVTTGSKIWALPDDSGPMALYYNSKVLAQYHITPPSTWAQFAADAATLHKDNPKVYMTNFAATDLQWVLSLMAQYGAYPFRYSGGSAVTIDFTGPKQMAFASYWQKLLSQHLVTSVADFSAQSDSYLDTGVDATEPISAWFPSYFAPTASKSVGDWRAAPLPQWSSTASVAANWGGSAFPVFTTSKHKAAAVVFDKWFTATTASWNLQSTPPTLNFPSFIPR